MTWPAATWSETGVFAELSDLPRDADGPVFATPWEAEAFAMTVGLHAAGIFTWAEWAATLSDEIKRAQAEGDPDLGNTYYHHWLAALERLVVAKNIVKAADLATCRAAWDEAVRRTPHGSPIELTDRDFAT